MTRCLVFCRHCGFIVAEFAPAFVPRTLKCPNCGFVEKVFWQRHCTQTIKYDEDGKIVGLHRWMIATSVQGSLGARLMRQFKRFNRERNGELNPTLRVR